MATAHDAERLLTDPAFIEATSGLREAIVKQIESLELGGSEAKESHAIELIRLLQTGKKYQRLLSAMAEFGRLKESDLERKKRFRMAGLG